METIQSVRLGVERLLEEDVAVVRDTRVGLICNQASVDHNYWHVADLLHAHPDINLRALFGPQHGIRGDAQDNMIETAHAQDRNTGLPVYSLYSETREPTDEMLADVDTLVFVCRCWLPDIVYLHSPNCMSQPSDLGTGLSFATGPTHNRQHSQGMY